MAPAVRLAIVYRHILKIYVCICNLYTIVLYIVQGISLVLSAGNAYRYEIRAASLYYRIYVSLGCHIVDVIQLLVSFGPELDMSWSRHAIELTRTFTWQGKLYYCIPYQETCSNRTSVVSTEIGSSPLFRKYRQSISIFYKGKITTTAILSELWKLKKELRRLVDLDFVYE